MSQAVDNRKPISEMSDSDKLTEIVVTLRALQDALTTLASNPMVRAMVPGGLKL